MESREFKGVWIPRELYLDKELSWTQKLLILEIDSFSRNGLPCFISNEHLSDHIGLGASTIEKSLKVIETKGYIIREIRKINGRPRRILRLTTGINYGHRPEKTTDDTQKKVRVATGKKYDIPIPTTKPINKPMKTSRPESLQVCMDYFLDLGMPNQAEPFMDWYDQTEWKLKGGNKIKDWKATARNWVRRQQKQQEQHAANSKGFRTENFDVNSIESFVTQG